MVDEFDLKLVQELRKNGKKSYLSLAKMLGVVEGTIRNRVKDLLKKNIIKIVAIPNIRHLGYNFISIMGLQVKMADLRKVADNLAKKPNICYLSFVTGRYDLIAIIMTRSPKELSHFIEEEISAIPSILRTETFVNLDIIKGGWPEIDTTQLVSSIDISPPSFYEE
jgi:Lrp/AsnC family transcriptional regulator for asnA, asnC and gidA